jgi:hypothetical protein
MRTFILFLVCILPCSQGFSQKIKFRKSFINHTEFGGLSGRVKYSDGGADSRVESKFSLTAQTFNGLRLSDDLSAGVAVGMDWYKTVLVNPIAAGVRYDLTKRGPAKLFATLDAGYGVTWLHQDSDGYNSRGGMMLNPGFGLKYGRPGGAAFTISLSYKRQDVKVNKPLQWQQTYRFEERVYNRVALRLGMTF